MLCEAEEKKNIQNSLQRKHTVLGTQGDCAAQDFFYGKHVPDFYSVASSEHLEGSNTNQTTSVSN